MKKMMLLGFAAVLLGGSVAKADDYHVYKLGNGECEIDTRDHGKMKDQRGSDDCKGHFSSRSSAEALRKKEVSGGKCKCPSGQNC